MNDFLTTCKSELRRIALEYKQKYEDALIEIQALKRVIARNAQERKAKPIAEKFLRMAK